MSTYYTFGKDYFVYVLDSDVQSVHLKHTYLQCNNQMWHVANAYIMMMMPIITTHS